MLQRRHYKLHYFDYLNIPPQQYQSVLPRHITSLYRETIVYPQYGFVCTIYTFCGFVATDIAYKQYGLGSVELNCLHGEIMVSRRRRFVISQSYLCMERNVPWNIVSGFGIDPIKYRESSPILLQVDLVVLFFLNKNFSTHKILQGN